MVHADRRYWRLRSKVLQTSLFEREETWAQSRTLRRERQTCKSEKCAGEHM